MAISVRPPVVSPVLVGRDDELRSLLAWESDPGPAPSVAVVSGPAGIGKTRLVQEVTFRLRDRRTRVVCGAAAPFGSAGAPYVPLLTALRSALPEDSELLRALTGASPSTRSRICDLLWRTVEGLAGSGRLVVVVDDLHWADAPTVDALLYLLAQPTVSRWHLLLTLRSDERREQPALSRLLEDLPTVRVTLGPLAEVETGQLLAAATGNVGSSEEVAVLHRRSGGVPLLVEEVLAAGPGTVPDHLRSLFASRVRAAGEGAAAVVTMLAALDGPGPADLVAEALARDPRTTTDELQVAVDQNLLVVDAEGYRLRHDLLRETLYDSLPPGRRRSLHASVARVLAARGAEPARLALHWYRAGQPAPAAAAAWSAAVLAERHHDQAAAHRHFERVLELWPQLAEPPAPGVTRAEVLRRAAAAAERAGRFARATGLVERLLREEPADRATTALRWSRLAAYHLGSGDGRAASGAFRQALVTLDGVDAPAERIEVLAQYARFLGFTHDRERARQLADEARALAPVDALQRCRVLMAWGQAHADRPEGLRCLREARDLAAALDAGQELAVSHAQLAIVLRTRGKEHERESVLRQGLGYVAAHGLRDGTEAVLRCELAGALLDAGRWDEADAVLTELRGRGPGGLARMFASAYAARLVAWRGAPDLQELIAEVRTRAEAIPQQPMGWAIAAMAAAEAAIRGGESTAAPLLTDHALPGTRRDPVWRTEAIMLLARAGARLPDLSPGLLRPEVARALEGLDVAVGPRQHALGTSARAELSRWAGKRAPDPWRRAVEAWQRVGDPYRLAEAEAALAWALLGSRSGRAEARQLLHEAAGSAERLGARPLLVEIRQLADRSALRLTANAAVPPNPFALTPRELEVLEQLMTGRSNAEIARLLGLSARTVGVHVSRILSKLGVARRTEAVVVAQRAGLDVRRSTDVPELIDL